MFSMTYTDGSARTAAAGVIGLPTGGPDRRQCGGEHTRQKLPVGRGLSARGRSAVVGARRYGAAEGRAAWAGAACRYSRSNRRQTPSTRRSCGRKRAL